VKIWQFLLSAAAIYLVITDRRWRLIAIAALLIAATSI
jgi:hypothetical protein